MPPGFQFLINGLTIDQIVHRAVALGFAGGLLCGMGLALLLWPKKT